MTQNKHHSVYAQKSAVDLQQYMDKNPIAHKTITDLWKARPGVSRSSIEKAFKSVTGYRVKEYLVKVRLEHTRHFLREGMDIRRVSTKSHYKSQSAYCTAFKRIFNQSPTDWINEGLQ